MNAEKFKKTKKKLIERMVKQKFSNVSIQHVKRKLDLFEKYCEKKHCEDINIETIKKYLKEIQGIDFENPITRKDIWNRRPFLAFMDFYETGSFKKVYIFSKNDVIPSEYLNIYLKLSKYINSLQLNPKTKESKQRLAKKLFCFLANINVKNSKDITVKNITDFVNSLTYLSKTTIQRSKTDLRIMFNWLYEQNISTIEGTKIFPIIRKVPSNSIISYYTKEEIIKLLSVVDTDSKIGKRDYAILCLSVYYGLRIGDIQNLKFENINWNEDYIQIIQQKTKELLTLPLIEEVKLALIDYIKNARIEGDDYSEYIFLTMLAPYTKYKNSSMHRRIAYYMDKAGINYKNKHHGTHAIRHSLATNLMKENVPLSAISIVLGHSNSKTTEIYLSVDETNLKKLSLEVPIYE